jgi:hypothetical protein
MPDAFMFPEMASVDRMDETAAPSQTAAGRPPLWVVLTLLFVSVWLGARIVHNVTAAFTAVATSTATAPDRPAWPVRDAT